MERKKKEREKKKSAHEVWRKINVKRKKKNGVSDEGAWTARILHNIIPTSRLNEFPRFTTLSFFFFLSIKEIILTVGINL